MKFCPKCSNTFNFSSRLKSINHLVIECDKCKSKYKMKYSKQFIFIYVFLIVMISPMLNSFLPTTTFLFSMIRNISIYIITSLIVFFIISYFVKYEEYEEV